MLRNKIFNGCGVDILEGKGIKLGWGGKVLRGSVDGRVG